MPPCFSTMRLVVDQFAYANFGGEGAGVEVGVGRGGLGSSLGAT